MGAELFHADRQTDSWTNGRTDGRTDITNLIVVSRSFAKRLKSFFWMTSYLPLDVRIFWHHSCICQCSTILIQIIFVLCRALLVIG
jgi:hypothetical protein